MSEAARDSGTLRRLPSAGSHARQHSAGEINRKFDFVDPDLSTRVGDWAFTDKNGLTLSTLDGAPVLPIATPARTLNLFAKSIVDFCIALSALVFLAPLFILVAVAIKVTSPGPVFFIQMREGLRGRYFPTFKFRTMRSDLCDSTGLAFTRAGDPRITVIGRFLRSTSIDELPQLINVLRGEMSIVGPRPHVPNMLAGEGVYEEVVPYYGRRLEMLPGITGWAQINRCRGLVDSRDAAFDRVDHDIAYIQNFSLMLDLKIVVWTALREFIFGKAN